MITYSVNMEHMKNAKIAWSVYSSFQFLVCYCIKVFGELRREKVIAIHRGWVYEGLNYGPYLTIEEQIALKATTDT